MSDLQDNISVYSNQYKKLEDLTKFTFELARKNGLEAELLKDKRAQEFIALTSISNNDEQSTVQGGAVTNPIFKQLIS